MLRQLDITSDGYLSLMKDDGDTKDDVKVPENDIGKKISEAFEGDKTVSKYQLLKLSARSHQLILSDVIILTAMGEEAAIDCKTVND